MFFLQDPFIEIAHITNGTHLFIFLMAPTYKYSKIENGTHLFIFFIAPTYKNSSHCKWDPLVYLFQ
jgi:hypothetical protein